MEAGDIANKPEPDHVKYALGRGGDWILSPWKHLVPYVPVKHKPLSRQEWFAKKNIVDRMKSMRKEIEDTIKPEKDALWKQHLAERDALDAQTAVLVDAVMQQIKAHYQPYWKEMYKVHRNERRHLKQVLAYEAQQLIGKPPSAKRHLNAAVKPKDRLAELDKEHEATKKKLGLQQKKDVEELTAPIEEAHREQFKVLSERQTEERRKLREELLRDAPEVTFHAAKASLQAERSAAEREFAEERKFKQPPTHTNEQEQAPTLEQRLNRPSERAEDRAMPDRARGAEAAPPVPRSEQIKRDMAEWRECNPNKDKGREME